MRTRTTLGALTLLLAMTATASAQPCGPAPSTPVAITADAILCFEPSPDHNANDVAGNPKVASYTWGHYLPGAAEPVQSWPLGKPTPVNGAIRVKPEGLVSVPLEVLYVARVAAVGSNGLRGVSDPSNPFYRPGGPAAPRGLVWILGL